jgi:hypothetical protein
LEFEGQYLSNWTETRKKDGRLLGVSAIGERLGKFVPQQSIVINKSYEKLTSQLPVTQVTASEENFTGKLDESTQCSTSPINEKENSNPSVKNPSDIGNYRKDWIERQNSVWSLRSHKSDNHVRLAFMQWKVDDSYRHPLFDLAMPIGLEKNWYDIEKANIRKKELADILNLEKERLTNNNSAKSEIESANLTRLAHAVAEANQGKYWTYSKKLPSWAEHRRRKLLEEALRACHEFGVNVLVLPEYSVRPDTVKWLKEKLEQTDCQVTILAGTYRLYGRRNEEWFDDCYSDILGIKEFENIQPNNRTYPKDLIKSGERSSILSLLLPIKDNNSSFVSVFTRRKKYPAMAAKEVFNPGTDAWEPLFSLKALVNNLQRRPSSPTISAEDLIGLLDQVQEERYLAELICSELFVITNPANWINIASEYHKLLTRFGSTEKLKTVIDKIQYDIWQFARFLGASGLQPLQKEDQTSSTGIETPRRSIILLPAMTSRSADYWIFGQSALLAAGITTVFCNAVADKDSVGGSCVIGRESWKDGKDSPGIPSLITPYSGWSRGIYYNDKNDPLGKNEQAMVIVDIDPINMMEGKPRPQALPVPLQLVAHLPITETIDWRVKPGYTEPSQHISLPFKRYDELGNVIEKILKIQPKSQLVNPNSKHENEKSLFETAKDLASYFGDEKENGKTVFENRLDKWKEDGRELPYANYPPALMDWLWVDLTPPSDEDNYPEIFVPPWVSKD